MPFDNTVSEFAPCPNCGLMRVGCGPVRCIQCIVREEVMEDLDHAMEMIFTFINAVVETSTWEGIDRVGIASGVRGIADAMLYQAELGTHIGDDVDMSPVTAATMIARCLYQSAMAATDEADGLGCAPNGIYQGLIAGAGLIEEHAQKWASDHVC